LVSIPRAVAAYAVEKGYKKVGLIGTSFTMEKDYMKKDLLDAGIEVVIPDEEERELVARKIFEELEFGVVKESTLDEFNRILKRMQEDQKIEAVILGCTELPLLLNNQNCCLPCIDSVDVHIRKLIEMSMES
jgi:aspartate racemase